MKTLFTFVAFLQINFAFSQFSFLKELNTIEEGSNPANFVEANGLVFFTIRTNDGNRLWKTDGTEAGTVQISEKHIQNQHKTLRVVNNEVYYSAITSLNTYQLWKTDGFVDELVPNIFESSRLYFLNNQVCYLDSDGLYKIENGNKTLIKDLSSTPAFTQPPPILKDNQLIFFTQQTSVSNRIKVWKSDGTESGTTSIKDIDSLYYIPGGNNDYNKNALVINNDVYFVIRRRLQLSGSTKIVGELWKTDGNTTTFIKRLYQTVLCCSDNSQFYNLANFNGKLIFLYDNSQLWISDGTSSGTTKLKNLSTFYDTSNKKWGILGDKFYFNNVESGESELWASDGTEAGTVLFKDLNPTGQSSPNFFTTINDKLFFKANGNELWQSDGTLAGTAFVQNIAIPVNSAYYYSVNPEFIYTSTNQLYFSNYDAQNDFELWKSDGTLQNTGLVKNIVTYSKSGILSSIKVKIGNTWYFSGTDHRGSELWKTDGTAEGTTLVKNITTGGFSTIIREMVAVGNTIYFTAQNNNNSNLRFYKSDGTESGTVEIVLGYGFPYGTTVDKLMAGNTKLYFMAFATGLNYTLWVLDDTSPNPRPISTSQFNNTPSNLTVVNNKLFFTSDGLWVSDGTLASTFKIYGSEFYNVPSHPICLVELNGKIYFFSHYFDTSFTFRTGLFESDGTRVGSKLVKEFPLSDNLTETYLLFLEKSANRLYFRAGYNYNYGSQYFNLWTSDGTEAGTYKLTTINHLTPVELKFNYVADRFYLFMRKTNSDSELSLLASDGTIEGTKTIFTKPFTFLVTVGSSFNNKLYFTLSDLQFGNELWASNGTNEGTYMVKDQRVGSKSFSPNTFMGFNDKLVFGAYNDTQGNELWQYLPENCEGNRNYSIQSGSWSDASTWSCGSVPSIDDYVIIKNPHAVTIPNSYRTTIKQISTESGAVLNAPNSSIISIRPN